MSGQVIHSPEIEHRCFLFFPAEAGLFAAVGTRWKCECGAIWQLVKGQGWHPETALPEPIRSTEGDTK